MRDRKVYTPEEKAAGLAALAANGDDVSKAARDLGVSRSTLRRWRDNAPEAVRQIGQQKKADLAELLEGLARKAAGVQDTLLDHVAQGDHLEDALAHWSDVNRVMGTALDKAANLRGEPSARTVHELSIKFVDDWRDRGADG